MGIKCGIVGLPNVGKSTLFNALTSAEIQAENYPFCTIDPNIGVAAVPDPRLDVLAEIVSPEKVIPTAMEFVDIAGLVEGASKGEGLGNQFLSHIRETDAIGHVVRCFIDEDVVHVSATVDPIADIEIINTELALADLERLEKAWDRNHRKGISGDRQLLAFCEFLKTVIDGLNEGVMIRTQGLTADQMESLKEFQLITVKPMMYIANVDEASAQGNDMVDKVKQLAAEEGAVVVILCASIEAEISQLDEADKMEFLHELGESEPGLNRVIRAGYELLGLQTYFTAGEKEVRAWTCKKGAVAPKAAGVIHTDFEKGFIRAEVISYQDYVAYHGEAGAREAGVWRLEGKEYIVQEGDVLHFRFAN